MIQLVCHVLLRHTSLFCSLFSARRDPYLAGKLELDDVFHSSKQKMVQYHGLQANNPERRTLLILVEVGCESALLQVCGKCSSSSNRRAAHAAVARADCIDLLPHTPRPNLCIRGIFALLFHLWAPSKGGTNSSNCFFHGQPNTNE